MCAQICGRGDTVEALTHVLAQHRPAATNPRSDAAVSCVIPGTGSDMRRNALIDPPRPLSEPDFARVKAAVHHRDAPSESSAVPLSSFVDSGAGAGRGAPSSIMGHPVPELPSPRQRQQKSRWSSSTHGVSGSRPAGTAAVEGTGVGVEGGESGSHGIDQRLFAPVLRAILAGEGDHVLRRSLLCHPFLKASKGGASSTGGSSSSSSGGTPWGSGSGAGSKGFGSGLGRTSSPLSAGDRRKEGKGSKGGKAKKRDRDRDRDKDTSHDVSTRGKATAARDAASSGKGAGARGGKSGARGTGGGVGDAGMSTDRSTPLNVSREIGRLAERAAADGSLQSTLILVKTLLCSVDPGTQSSSSSSSSSSVMALETERRPAVSNQDRAGRSAPGSTMTPATSTGLMLKMESLRALASSKGLSDWSDLMELLRRERYRERMVQLRGQPSLTVCSGKAEVRGRLETKGESSGIVTAVHVRRMC